MSDNETPNQETVLSEQVVSEPVVSEPVVSEPVVSENSSEKKEKPKKKQNLALKAFFELSKHIAKILDVPNGIPVKKLAKLVKTDTAEKYPGLDSISIMKKAKEHFNDNVENYKEKL